MRKEIADRDTVDWANNSVNFPAGPPWGGQPTKVEPLDKKFTPDDEAPAPHMNYALNQIGNAAIGLDEFAGSVEPNVWQPPINISDITKALVFGGSVDSAVHAVAWDPRRRRWLALMSPRNGTNGWVLVYTEDNGRTWKIEYISGYTANYPMIGGLHVSVDGTWLTVMNNGRCYVREYNSFSVDIFTIPGWGALGVPPAYGYASIHSNQPNIGGKVTFQFLARQDVNLGTSTQRAAQVYWTGTNWAGVNFDSFGGIFTGIPVTTRWKCAFDPVFEGFPAYPGTTFWIPDDPTINNIAITFDLFNGFVRQIVPWSLATGIAPQQIRYIDVPGVYTGLVLLAVSNDGTNKVSMRRAPRGSYYATWENIITKTAGPSTFCIVDFVFVGGDIVAITGIDQPGALSTLTHVEHSNEVYFTTPAKGLARWQTFTRAETGKVLFFSPSNFIGAKSLRIDASPYGGLFIYGEDNGTRNQQFNHPIRAGVNPDSLTFTA